jgi:hypothetical protein
MNRDHVFWAVFGVFVLGCFIAWSVFVRGLNDENSKILRRRDCLLSRLTPVNSLGTGKSKQKFIPAVGNTLKNDVKKFDNTLKRLYPLSGAKNLNRLESDKKLAYRKKEAVRLAKEHERLADLMKAKSFSVQVDDQGKSKDFLEVVPRNMKPPLFRTWVGRTDEQTDKMISKLSEGTEFLCLSSSVQLLDENVALGWLKDGRVNGWIPDSGGTIIQEKSRELVLRRLVLRRLLLRAVMRTEAQGIPKRIPDGAGEKVVSHPRRVGRLLLLSFAKLDAIKTRGGLPYRYEEVLFKISCHLATVPALLKSLETIGEAEGGRPFTLWIKDLQISRPSGWPGVNSIRGDVNTTRAKDYGRYMEWPVTAEFKAIIPLFTSGDKKKSGKK